MNARSDANASRVSSREGTCHPAELRRGQHASRQPAEGRQPSLTPANAPGKWAALETIRNLGQRVIPHFRGRA
jgi:hypothetical protein